MDEFIQGRKLRIEERDISYTPPHIGTLLIIVVIWLIKEFVTSRLITIIYKLINIQSIT